MENSVEALQVSLEKDGFCVATGPHDFGIEYPCDVKPFAPVLLGSPVVFHLYCPKITPNEVVKIHAEHLGHFLALQNVPRIDVASERVLFLGLCKLFTRERVLALYEQAFTEPQLLKEVADSKALNSHPSVFVKFHTHDPIQYGHLLHTLLDLFVVEDLRENDLLVTPEDDGEPEHMLFLYLVQLLAVFVSSCVAEGDLALILGVASSVFLEGNFSNPLCAATLLKPMFVPCFAPLDASKKGKRGAAGSGASAAADDGEDPRDPVSALRCYRLFTGYELDSAGAAPSSCMDDDTLSWTARSLGIRALGPKLREAQRGKRLWFVAPQMGDRLAMMNWPGTAKLMSGQPREITEKIISCLVSDNVMAYLQCAIFSTIVNMLPCRKNSDFSEPVMNAIGGSMRKLSDEIRRQSATLLADVTEMTSRPRRKVTCLSVAGIGFFGQGTGDNLAFGRVFTGPKDHRPRTASSENAFTSVALGISDAPSMTQVMLGAALNQAEGVRDIVATKHKPVAVTKVESDMYFYGRYRHAFNTGDFTEVAGVKAMSDPSYKKLIHHESLTKKAAYQLTVCNGALPMCALTLALTMRQAIITTLGFMCAELTRAFYSCCTKDNTLATMCARAVALSIAAKFRCGKVAENETRFSTTDARYGNFMKVTGCVFSQAGRAGQNFYDLDSMEWLQADNPVLPDYLKISLAVIGDTRREVVKIMKQENMRYNRVLFENENGPMTFTAMFANHDFMTHAPLMIMSALRVFTNTTSNVSFGTVKMVKQRCFYPVKVFSNRCIDLNRGQNADPPESKHSASTIDEMVARIKRVISSVLPRIRVDRVKMMNPGLLDDKLQELLGALKKHNIQVIGECADSDAGLPENKGVKRYPEGEPSTDEPKPKKTKVSSELRVYDSDNELDFGSDDSE